MNHTYSKASLAVAATLVASQAGAQQIETISVIGARQPIELSRLSASVSVIDRTEIEDSGAISLSDLLRGLPGVSISQDGVKGSQTQVRLRGSEANHVLVLVDGVEINSLSDGAVDFAHLNLDNVERIELLRGPQSSLWGSGAVGGVISITTRQTAEALQANTRLEVGEDSSRRVSADVGGNTEQFSYALAFTHFSTEGQNIARQGEERDGYRNNEISARLSWSISEHSKLLTQFRHQDAYSEFDGSDPETGLRADAEFYSDVRASSGRVEWHYSPLSSIWQQQLGFHFSSNEIITTDGFGGETDSNRQRWFWQHDFSYAADSRATVSVEHVEEEFTQTGTAYSPAYDPNQDQENGITSLIGDIAHKVSDQINLNASLRHDNSDNFDDALSYRVGANYLFSDSKKVFISLGKAVKNPTFIERFGFYPGSFVGNPDLIPEQSRSVELGIELPLYKDWHTAVSVFHTQLDNEIDGNAGLPNYLYTAVNKDGESRQDGLEWSLSGKLAELSIDLSYSYLDASEEVEVTEQGQPPVFTEQVEVRRARHQANLTLNYGFWNEKVNVYVQANYQGTRIDNFFSPVDFKAIPVPLAAATTVNTAITFRPDPNWTFALRAENLFDHDYEEVVGYQRQGRSAYLSMSHSF